MTNMIELLGAGIFLTVLALCNIIRLAKGPSAADRAVAADCADTLICCAMVLFSLFSGRAIYLDIAVISALLGVIDTVLVGRYLEGRL